MVRATSHPGAEPNEGIFPGRLFSQAILTRVVPRKLTGLRLLVYWRRAFLLFSTMECDDNNCQYEIVKGKGLV